MVAKRPVTDDSFAHVHSFIALIDIIQKVYYLHLNDKPNYSGPPIGWFYEMQKNIKTS